MHAPSVYDKFVDSNGDPILINCAVLYIDVLGIREYSRDPNRTQILRSLLRALEIAREEAMLEENEAWQALTWFTDNVFVAFPIMPGHFDEEPALGSALRAAAYIQLRLAVEGHLVRGGIAFGEVHMAPHTAFGPALIDAVELESRARVPRVVLSEDAIDLQRKMMTSYRETAPQELEMAVDPDGEVFVDYLNFWRQEEHDPNVFRRILARHTHVIKAGLSKHEGEPSVRSKYEWLASYHDWAIEDWPEAQSESIGPTKATFRRVTQ